MTKDGIVRIGVVSDTHGYLDPRVLPLLWGVDRIIHAGDIGSLEVIQGLEALAPVTVVRGNNDRQGATAGYLEEQVLDIGGKRLLLTHQVKLSRGGESSLPPDFRERGLEAVVFGHSHMALEEWREGVLLFNSGAVGKRRFRVVSSVGILEVEGEGIRSRVIPL